MEIPDVKMVHQAGSCLASAETSSLGPAASQCSPGGGHCFASDSIEQRPRKDLPAAEWETRT